jgi:hypothetical protein
MFANRDVARSTSANSAGVIIARIRLRNRRASMNIRTAHTTTAIPITPNGTTTNIHSFLIFDPPFYPIVFVPQNPPAFPGRGPFVGPHDDRDSPGICFETEPVDEPASATHDTVFDRPAQKYRLVGFDPNDLHRRAPAAALIAISSFV